MLTLSLILVAIFILAGWGTAEMNYRTEKKKAAKYKRSTLVYKQKSEKLESLVEHREVEYNELNDAYQYARVNSEKQRQTTAMNETLQKDLTRYQDVFAWLDKKVRSREYTGNSLAKVIKTHLESAFPSEELMAQQQNADSKETFQRIKKSMGDGG